MTNDQIIQWAREAGFMDMDSLSAKVTDMFYHGFPRTERIHLCSDDRIENFAALVAAAERKECAKACQNVVDGGEYDGWQQYAAAACRDEILARGKKGQS